jgi:hypothetical protein
MYSDLYYTLCVHFTDVVLRNGLIVKLIN